MPELPSDRPTVLFDLDGTVLDSAPGIIAAQQEAMIEVGLEPAPAELLRRDLGPPPAVIFTQLGVPESLLDRAVLAYRRHYLDEGIRNARVYPGVVEVLTRLGEHYRLATATMKRVDTAIPFLEHHGLGDHFQLVGGASDGVTDKTAIIAATREALGDPDPETMIMVGDRHSDISGGRTLRMRTIAVCWGYGSRDELLQAEPDAIVDSPGELPETIAGLLKG